MTIVVHESISFDFHQICGICRAQLIDKGNYKSNLKLVLQHKSLEFRLYGVSGNTLYLNGGFARGQHVFTVLGYLLFDWKQSWLTIAKNR